MSLLMSVITLWKASGYAVIFYMEEYSSIIVGVGGVVSLGPGEQDG